MNGMIGLGGTLAVLLLVGAAIGLTNRRFFAARWLFLAAALVALNDVLLTRAYGTIPNLVPGSDWNWQGKVLALVATLIVAALPSFGWRRVGLTLDQARGSLTAALPVVLAYCAFFAAVALALPNDTVTAEDIAFQLTMPGLEEEAFYRGVLLFALDRAFTGRVRFLGVEWGWGAALSCLLFGMAHAFGYADGAFSLDAPTMAMTALPSVVGVWLRYRTGSILLPVVIHDFGNLAVMTF